MSTSASLPVQIYESQLAPLGYGLPLWSPEPDDTQGPVEIGDVGYMFDGSFRKLFNVTKPMDDPDSMPPRFTQLAYSRQMHVISRRRHLSLLVSSRSVEKVNIDGDASIVASPANVKCCVSFQCTGNQGALLAVDDDGVDQEILRENQLFPDYMLEHHKSWHKFTRAKGFSMKPQDLIMVRGTIKARRWLVAAFNGESRELSVTAGGISDQPGGSLLVSMTNSQSPMCRFGPEGTTGDITDQAGKYMDDTPKDQCVFLSRYKLRSRWPDGPRVIRAVGEHQDEHRSTDSEDDVDGQLAGDSGSDRYIEDDLSHMKTLDPVDILLEYILEKSTCDAAFASDEDVRILAQELDNNATTEGLNDYLQSRQPDVIVSTSSGCLVGRLASSSNELLIVTRGSDTFPDCESRETSVLDNIDKDDSDSLPTMQGFQPSITATILEPTVQSPSFTGLQESDLFVQHEESQPSTLEPRQKLPLLPTANFFCSPSPHYGGPSRIGGPAMMHLQSTERSCTEGFKQARLQKQHKSAELNHPRDAVVLAEQVAISEMSRTANLSATGSEEDLPLNAHMDITAQYALSDYQVRGNPVPPKVAIQYRPAIVSSTDGNAPDPVIHSTNLVMALKARYNPSRELREFCVPDSHVGKPSLLDNLASSLRTRSEQFETIDALDGVILRFELMIDNDSKKLMWLAILETHLQDRYEQLGDLEDIEQAINLHLQSLDLISDGHQLKPVNAELSLRAQAERVGGIEAEDLSQRTSYPPPSRLDDPGTKRRTPSEYFGDLNDLDAAGFPHCFNAPPELTVREACGHALDPARGRYASKEMKAVVSTVNSAAVVGRAVAWSQVAHLHTLDDIQQVYLQLAQDVYRVSRHLDDASFLVLSAPMKAIQPSPDAYPQRFYICLLEADHVIADIRELEGCKKFMLPKTLTQLAATCAAIPVVIIYAHDTRCDALILHRSDVGTLVLLHLLPQEQATGLRKDLHSPFPFKTLRYRFCGVLHVDQYNRYDHTLQSDSRHVSMSKILRDLWNLVVKPTASAIDVLPSIINGSLPRITWCPAGPLAFLPLHVAGIYLQHFGDHTPTQSVMDVAVYFYAPNLDVLLRARTTLAAGNTRYPKALIISQPDTSVKGTMSEAGMIIPHLDPSATRILDGADGTIDAVHEGMTTHDWVHYAYHEIQNNEDPSQSSFALHNGQLTLEKLLPKYLPVLAVLTACQTATCNDSGELPAEASHLAAVMLDVGYKSAVGTVWSVPGNGA